MLHPKHGSSVSTVRECALYSRSMQHGSKRHGRSCLAVAEQPLAVQSRKVESENVQVESIQVRAQRLGLSAAGSSSPQCGGHSRSCWKSKPADGAATSRQYGPIMMVAYVGFTGGQ